MTFTRRATFFLALTALGTTLPTPSAAQALSAQDIQTQINNHNEKIQALQQEIAQYQKKLDTLDTKRSTLESTLQSLTLSRRELTAQIAVTQNKISAATLQLDRLALAIADTGQTIQAQKSAIASALRSINEADSFPLAVSFLNADRLSDAWIAADRAEQLTRALGEHIGALNKAKTQLNATRASVAQTKETLAALQNDLLSQRKSIDLNRQSQRQLLRQTKNKESAYQKLIKEKKAAARAFEQELASLQSQLNLIVHPGSIPRAGTGILAWPFSAAYMDQCARRATTFGNSYCITQYFGNTPFATANPQVYGGHGHNGIDISAPIGTPVDAALAGTVLATGDTDLSHNAAGQQCYSFGKWVMISHANGLNTMYAHLSEIDVTKGQGVKTGQRIGYSGMTGYATGPHLHFGVYAAEGTKIMTLGQFRGTKGTRCANASMPVAAPSAYLNPLSYLI